MKITHTPTTRETAVTALGPHWPPLPGSAVARVLGLAGAVHGALSVHGTDGQPGRAWWVVDGLIVPQDAGPPPTLPGCPVETVPEPAAEPSPPVDLAPTP
ncbi:hypothetical protein ACW4TU_30200 [Streptomyces sp. QTS52]